MKTRQNLKKTWYAVFWTILFMGAFFLPRSFAENSIPSAKSPGDVKGIPIQFGYFEIKDLHAQKRWLSQEDGDQSQIDLINEEMQSLRDGLRATLFRHPDEIAKFYKLRTQVFKEVFRKVEAEYFERKETNDFQDELEEKALFHKYQWLEMKVLRIQHMMQKAEQEHFEKKAQKRFEELLKKYRRSDRADKAAQLFAKKEILKLLVAVMLRYQYPKNAIEQVEKKAHDIDQLLSVYAYWEDTEESGENDFVTRDDPSYREKLPVGPHDDSQPLGRQKYINKVVSEGNDMRNFDGVVKLSRPEDRNVLVYDKKYRNREVKQRMLKKELEE